LLILIKMSATNLNNTNNLLLLSDYIDDKEKQIVLAKLEEELEKWNAHIWLMSSQKTTLFLTFDMGEWRENCVVNMKDGKVCIAIDEGMLEWFKDERKYKDDPALLQAFYNYFTC
jgi:hypothetical protein